MSIVSRSYDDFLNFVFNTFFTSVKNVFTNALKDKDINIDNIDDIKIDVIDGKIYVSDKVIRFRNKKIDNMLYRLYKFVSKKLASGSSIDDVLDIEITDPISGKTASVKRFILDAYADIAKNIR
jgi:hypothetical protein